MINYFDNFKNLYPEVDYQALMAQMQNESHPRRKLKELQNKGYLTRLKKGFYVFNKNFIGRDYSAQIVANLLCGPSYLSLEYALAYYGLIPERVEVFTCVTNGKNKIFQTPIGSFSYRHLSASLYPYGITLKEGPDGRRFLVASAEKALLDIFTLKFEKTTRPLREEIIRTLEQDLRINLPELFTQIHRPTLEGMRSAYKNRKWERALIDFLLEEK
jgi:predicted transcriptional regulator of viral defense system